ncbi:DMT family transporter [Clostridium sp. ZS2-4]|uniref:DMT family transporter n=1 Tax=Clostridium sp. ZS2-4 TaxID=2987703 RepID=UPI00227B7500|nr:DMT family transporter [Clostridium sp. ZS2-4]MCY6353817.1 DMT family transporter [Clostridium sp. ZS2-4]
MLYIILAFIAGCLVLLSMIINSQLAKRIGVFQGTFVNYIVGLLFTIIVLLFRNDTMNLSFNSLSNIPFWAYLGGLVGVIVVAISNIVIPKIPTIYSTLLIFSGQLFTGIIIDYFTGNLISKGKIIGGFLIIAGLTYNFSVDKKSLVKSEA